jgi:hypothetical protein
MESLGITIANNLGLKNFKVVGTQTKYLRTGRTRYLRYQTHRLPDPAARSLKRKDLEKHFVVAQAFVQNLFRSDRQLYVTSDELPNCELLCMDFLWGRFKLDNPHSQDSEQMPQTAAQEEKSFLTPAEDAELPESSSFAVPAPLAALAQSMARLTNSLANSSVSFSLMAQPGFLSPQPSVAPHAQPFDHRHPNMPSYPGYSPAPMRPSAPLNPRAVPFEPTKSQSS